MSKSVDVPEFAPAGTAGPLLLGADKAGKQPKAVSHTVPGANVSIGCDGKIASVEVHRGVQTGGVVLILRVASVHKGAPPPLLVVNVPGGVRSNEVELHVADKDAARLLLRALLLAAASDAAAVDGVRVGSVAVVPTVEAAQFAAAIFGEGEAPQTVVEDVPQPDAPNVIRVFWFRPAVGQVPVIGLRFKYDAGVLETVKFAIMRVRQIREGPNAVAAWLPSYKAWAITDASAVEPVLRQIASSQKLQLWWIPRDAFPEPPFPVGLDGKVLL